MPEPITCCWCGVEIKPMSLVRGQGVEWHEVTFGNISCGGPQDSPRHRPDLPDLTDRDDVEAWLAGVKEGLDP